MAGTVVVVVVVLVVVLVDEDALVLEVGADVVVSLTTSWASSSTNGAVMTPRRTAPVSTGTPCCSHSGHPRKPLQTRRRNSTVFRR